MRYSDPLVLGALLRRYQRFIADVRLASGEIVQAHVPNSGAMTGCSAPNSPCLVSPASSPARRLAWTLEQVFDSGIAVGVNTARANRLGEEALLRGIVSLPELVKPWTLRREVSVGEGSRLDLRLEDRHGALWVEVKNVTWTAGGLALFPDAPTSRGARHLAVLARRVGLGERAALLYVVQRGDATAVSAAGHVDPAYAEALARARDAGVGIRAVQVAVAPAALQPWREIPVLGV